MTREECLKILRRIHDKVPCKRSKLVVKEEIEKLERVEKFQLDLTGWTGPSSTGDNRGY